jgi:DNA-binding MarR family transcriptional regulator
MSAPPDDPAHVAIRLRAAVSHLGRKLRAGMPVQALGSAALSALSQLYRRGPLTPTQLAQHEGVKLQTLTRLLAELEAAGQVSRRPHPSDGRQSVLALTPRGARVLTAEARRREASLASVLAERLAPAERAALLAACELIERVADGVVEAAPPASGTAAAVSMKAGAR